MKLSIPEPCHENWNEMSPTDKGRFCGSCQKEVTDFTQMTKVEIKEFFIRKASESTCGRFENRQIESFNRPEIKPKRINTKPWWIAAATFFLFGNRGVSQDLLPSRKVKQKQVQTDSTKKKTTVAVEAPKPSNVDPGDSGYNYKPISISGKLIEKDSSKPIAFGNIYVEIDSNVYGVCSDFDGNFELKIPNTSHDSLIIKVVFIGYDKLEINIPNTDTSLGNVELGESKSCSTMGFIIVGSVDLKEYPHEPKTINDKGVLRRLFRFR